MMSVMEEKTNRIIEIIISSVKPFNLMTGKIIGVSLAGLTQVFIWMVMFFAFSFIFSSIFGISSSYDSGELMLSSNNGDGLSSFALEMISAFMNLPLTNIFIAFILYFIGGYLLYAAIFASIGAAIDNQADAQQFMIPITLYSNNSIICWNINCPRRSKWDCCTNFFLHTFYISDCNVNENS